MAYREDGTMVVVEGRRKYLGRFLEVTVTSMLQTDTDRIVFTRPRERERLERACA